MEVKKNAVITIRLTDQQRALLGEAAKAAGLNVSEYVRLLILKDVKLI